MHPLYLYIEYLNLHTLQVTYQEHHNLLPTWDDHNLMMERMLTCFCRMNPAAQSWCCWDLALRIQSVVNHEIWICDDGDHSDGFLLGCDAMSLDSSVLTLYCLKYSLKMDTAHYSETLVPIYQSKWHHALKEAILSRLKMSKTQDMENIFQT